MNKWKKVFHALLFPPSPWGIIIFVLSLFFVAGVFALFNSVSGIAVSVIVLGIAVFMLIKARKSLSLDRNGGSTNE